MNVMLEPRIDKVVVHVGVGESGQRLVNAETIMKTITKQQPVRSMAKKTLPTFNIKKKEPIGAKLTLRGKAAEDFLVLALKAAGNSLKMSQFDQQGNFSFGIEEHTDFPGMRYDPEIGIFGMDVSVALKRAGYRIARRRVAKKKLPSRQRLGQDDTVEFIKKKFGVEVLEAA
ncbi:MAG TPA: 50S ribosomal protein L5 [Methanothrix soehngenii]|jgi:large subunit ribosomal protein L5|uniref:50S ribosomal protein L5 n=2 Tax=Methanotrichaceae TaxID=143067 RepID=UPI0023EF8306|nr:50S ribosomal protein L5 [Methanothrix soehngenii]MCK9586102.1 50S ribosomal protein L5 [Methanothrix soehngenii]MDD3974084.1 50S ribosomal protein L5 [Methanothrix soehngenii]MDD5257719.1 50S ribosomal protein L5 [Methanothrix soehngenii]MDD5734211.1 50S ribosomal protein L5 [Methanothrix soehngenii]HOG97561.1 50S ribosomal protein L5 [Methanothrix soehngenii]